MFTADGVGGPIVASDFVCSFVSCQRLDFVLSFTYQTSCAMNARLALPAADLIVGTIHCLQMAFAASVPLQHHDQTRPRPSDRLAG